MKVLIACEESQAVCIEFRKLGHEAYSCDLQECSGCHPEWHIQDNIWHVLGKPGVKYPMFWDLIIAHPPCTYLSNSGVRWLYNYDKTKNAERWENMKNGALFFKSFLYCNCDHIAIENPVIHKYALEIIGRKPDQIIQPWMFGDGETKATCLWLTGLPKLKWSNENNLFFNDTTSKGREQRIWKMAPGPERQKLRSKTFPGIAKAMAEQWSEYITINQNRHNFATSRH